MKCGLIFLLMMFGLCLAVDARVPTEASVKCALAAVKIMVVDQNGAVVSGAKIWGGFICGNGMNDFALVDGETDTNGIFVAKGRCNDFLRFDVLKEGYYKSEEKIYFRRSKAVPVVVDDKWQPYGETRTVVLKKICDPKPMIFSEGECREIPVFDAWIGYDLEKGDWVVPYGKGVLQDMQLRFTTLCGEGEAFCRTMEVSFTNCPYAGAYIMQRDTGSEFDTVYRADTNANFQTYLKYEFNHMGRKVFRDELGREQYLVFRIRAKVDEMGMLKSVLYGKLMGNWKFFECNNMWIERRVLNPTPNDVNLEDAETARRSRLWHKQFLERQEPTIKCL